MRKDTELQLKLDLALSPIHFRASLQLLYTAQQPSVVTFSLVQTVLALLLSGGTSPFWRVKC